MYAYYCKGILCGIHTHTYVSTAPHVYGIILYMYVCAGSMYVHTYVLMYVDSMDSLEIEGQLIPLHTVCMCSVFPMMLHIHTQ